MKNETMLKALLVDDEPFITKGLSVLVDWERSEEHTSELQSPS